MKVWFVGPERVTGQVGDQPWPGQMYWSEPFEDLEVGVKVAPNARLTAFEDHATPRPGLDDLYFQPDADQREVVPTLLVETKIEKTHVPTDLVLVAAFLCRRRRKSS